MANVTRIKNNQITDTTITYHKIVPGTLIGSLFNANITLNSNVSIIGNLSVAGYSSSVSSTNTYVNDPLVVFNNGYTGSLTGYDIGILINRNLNNLPGYGGVNTAFIWSEADEAFVALATSDTGAGITSLNNSGYANIKVGNITAYTLGSSNGITSVAFYGNAYGTNGSFTNLTSSNVSITGGNLSVTNGSATTLYAANFSTANAQITGGNATVTNFTANTGVSDNFSTANARISGGYADNITIGANTVAPGSFSALAANGAVTLTNTTQAIAFDNAAVVISGGLGVQKDVYIQGNLYVANVISSTNNTISVTDPLLYLETTSITPYDYDIGFFSHFLGGSNPAEQHTGIVRNHATDEWTFFSNVDPNPTLNTIDFSNPGTIYDTIKAGALHLVNTTPSTSNSTGALIVDGGVGIAGNLTVTGNVNVTLVQATAINGTEIGNATPAGATFTNLTVISNSYFSNNTEATASNVASVVLAGGLAVDKQIWANGVIVAASNTSSNTYTSGSFVTNGGVGVAGNVYINQGAVVNESNGSNSFVVEGVNTDTLIWARANPTYDQVVIGNTTTSGTIVQGAKLQINSTDAILLPSGTTGERPGTSGFSDVAGMLRFSTTTGAIEWYNGSSWTSGATSFTVIADQQFNGDDNTVAFTLSQAATTNSVIVSINGVVQIPTLAYAVGGVGNTTLTFTEAPATGDVIDVRLLTTTQTVTGLSSTNGYMQLVFLNNSINLYTGTASAVNTTSWNSTGAQVSKLANITIATSGVATTIDSFDKTVYRSAKYIVQASIAGSYHAQEALVVHDGSAASVQLGTAALTAGNLGTITATVSGSDVLLQFDAANNNTTVRIKKDYILI